jgi:hypothetical protein
MRKIFEVVKILDIEPFAAGDGDLFRFRLEIIHELDGKYMGKVYRQETYRLQPTFPQLKGNPPNWKSDAQVFIVDEVFDPEYLKGDSTKDVIVKFQIILDKIFKTKLRSETE